MSRIRVTAVCSVLFQSSTWWRVFELFQFTPVTMSGSQVGMKEGLKYTPSMPAGLASAGHFLRNNLRFTPSVMGMDTRSKGMRFTPVWALNKSHDPDTETPGEFTLDWWTENAIFRYDALLVSAFYGLSHPEFRDHYKIPRKDFLFIGDSGGFQIWSQGVKIEPLAILRWQERNVDVGLTLDVPPPSPVGTQWAAFEKAAEQSHRNFEIMHRNWKTDELELLKVIQGDNKKEMDYWWDVMKDLEFDGISVAPRPPNAEKISIGIGYAMEKEQKKCHVLLGTGDATIPTIIYAKKYFDRITVDSSSFSSAGAKFRTYYLPYSKGTLEFGGKFESKLTRLPCDCPVCQITDISDLNISRGGDKTKSASLSGGLIALHNLYVVLRHYYFLEVLSDDRDAYLEYLTNQGHHSAVESIKFLEDVDDRGFYDAYDTRFGTEDLGDVFG